MVLIQFYPIDFELADLPMRSASILNQNGVTLPLEDLLRVQKYDRKNTQKIGSQFTIQHDKTAMAILLLQFGGKEGMLTANLI